jgi:nicotinate-nucleotide adenylyltransferase
VGHGVRARIGVFGGTFDPPHIGHLVAASDARHRLGLDVVLLMVANVPWQKLGVRDVSPGEHRLAMVTAAVEGIEGLEGSDLELVRGGRSYTADTLAELAAIEPDADLFCILGADAAALFTTWERHEEVAERATLVVVDRPGSPAPVSGRFRWMRVDVPELEISSTDLRRRVGEGEPIDFLTPPGVVTCIRERDLYRLRP